MPRDFLAFFSSFFFFNLFSTNLAQKGQVGEHLTILKQITFFCLKNFKKKNICRKINKCYSLNFPISGLCNLTRALQSTPFQIPGGNVTRTDERRRSEHILSNIGWWTTFGSAEKWVCSIFPVGLVDKQPQTCVCFYSLDGRLACKHFKVTIKLLHLCCFRSVHTCNISLELAIIPHKVNYPSENLEYMSGSI